MASHQAMAQNSSHSEGQVSRSHHGGQVAVQTFGHAPYSHHVLSHQHTMPFQAPTFSRAPAAARILPAPSTTQVIPISNILPAKRRRRSMESDSCNEGAASSGSESTKWKATLQAVKLDGMKPILDKNRLGVSFWKRSSAILVLSFISSRFIRFQPSLCCCKPTTGDDPNKMTRFEDLLEVAKVEESLLDLSSGIAASDRSPQYAFNAIDSAGRIDGSTAVPSEKPASPLRYVLARRYPRRRQLLEHLRQPSPPVHYTGPSGQVVHA